MGTVTNVGKDSFGSDQHRLCRSDSILSFFFKDSKEISYVVAAQFPTADPRFVEEVMSDVHKL
jgi:hypothetical protein